MNASEIATKVELNNADISQHSLDLPLHIDRSERNLIVHCDHLKWLMLSLCQ